MSANHDDRHARADHRNEFALRRAHREVDALSEALARIGEEALRLLTTQPHLAGQDSRGLLGRVMTPETSPDFDSLVRRAALAVLAVRAKDREEQASPFTGDAA